MSIPPYVEIGPGNYPEAFTFIIYICDMEEKRFGVRAKEPFVTYNVADRQHSFLRALCVAVM